MSTTVSNIGTIRYQCAMKTLHNRYGIFQDFVIMNRYQYFFGYYHKRIYSTKYWKEHWARRTSLFANWWLDLKVSSPSHHFSKFKVQITKNYKTVLSELCFKVNQSHHIFPDCWLDKPKQTATELTNCILFCGFCFHVKATSSGFNFGFNPSYPWTVFFHQTSECVL